MIEDIRTCKTADCTENEVQGRSEGSLVEGKFETLHKKFRSRRVGSDIDSHVTHYAEETEQDERIAQKFQTSQYAGGLRVSRRLCDS